ncbi:MAG TPA: HAD family hydrolase, partial [Acidimicrobiales bacterium]|nr:HAD family hydrolase [Acidimicrobiales bacterium]
MSSTHSPVVAAFDLDGTLTEGGSVFAWLKAIAGSGATYRAAFALALPLVIGALRSGNRADQAKERLFRRLLAGRVESEVIAQSRDFA